MQYVIQVKANHDCFIADVDGDPGRTTIIENARIYNDKDFANQQKNQLKRKYPNRDFSVREVVDFL